MSKNTMKAVIGRAILDTEFRNALLADSDMALAPFDLTEAERASLKKIDSETLDTFAHMMETFVNKRLGSLWFSVDDGKPEADLHQASGGEKRSPPIRPTDPISVG
jgi:hypothetical protein